LWANSCTFSIYALMSAYYSQKIYTPSIIDNKRIAGIVALFLAYAATLQVFILLNLSLNWYIVAAFSWLWLIWHLQLIAPEEQALINNYVWNSGIWLFNTLIPEKKPTSFPTTFKRILYVRTDISYTEITACGLCILRHAHIT
jgi:hypothetical protein